MKGCEHGELWEEAAQYIKFDHNKISNKQCIRIPGFKGLLWHYQYLDMSLKLKFALDKKKNSINEAATVQLHHIIWSKLSSDCQENDFNCYGKKSTCYSKLSVYHLISWSRDIVLNSRRLTLQIHQFAGHAVSAVSITSSRQRQLAAFVIC